MPETVFVNLSNHSSTGWGSAQQAAATALADRVVDLSFPAVSPEADEEAVKRLAEETLSRLPAGATHAMVMGEFTLTFSLVAALQRRGICCLAATTERRVVQEKDGNKHSVFAFIRFRQYPAL